MQNENRFLSPAALLFVIAAHALLYWLLVSVKPPELPAEPPGLSFVDLGMLGGGGGGGGQGGDVVVEEEPAPAQGRPEQPPAPPQPKPEQPKPAPEQRAQIKPVERTDRPADIVQPKPQPEVKPVRPEPKPEPRPEAKPVAPANTPPSSTAGSHSAGGSSSGQGHGAPSAGSGGGSGGGQGTGVGPGQGSGRGPGSGSGEGGGHGSGIGSGNGPGTGGGGGGDSNPTHIGGYLNNPKPPYPPQLEEEGISGTVRLRVMVETNGKPSSVEVLSATHPLFGRSAEKTVRERYTFVPAKRNGQPIRASYTFTLRFTAR
ncbi:energy transducer TonB [Eikenella sp. S3360]|uniref:Protein TonB n=1 Tax=Eikenella glucosivorans TaxID=2766967 RepID=A0ABS0N8L8_9NEIS|nr:energy transducer TonB [Eikenella glucosivorans]MBH5328625.1 energy transducer TonB [Eikenella glucosivorans]